MGIRKTRSDCTVGAFEKSRGLPAGTIRNSDGRDARSDKKIGTIRRQAEKGKREPHTGNISYGIHMLLHRFLTGGKVLSYEAMSNEKRLRTSFRSRVPYAEKGSLCRFGGGVLILRRGSMIDGPDPAEIGIVL